jgi:hypothetical protein
MIYDFRFMIYGELAQQLCRGGTRAIASVRGRPPFPGTGMAGVAFSQGLETFATLFSKPWKPSLVSSFRFQISGFS